jgi:hypothetical protein
VIEVRTLSNATKLEIGGLESGAADVLSLSEADVEAFADGAESMLLISVGGGTDVEVVGAVTFHDPTTIRQGVRSSHMILVSAEITGDTADGSITLISDATHLGADVVTTGGGNITIENAILDTDVTLDTSLGGGDVELKGTLNALVGGEDLTILTGLGSATLNVGNKLTSSTSILPGVVTITGGDATIEKSFAMGALVIDGGGTTYVKGHIRTVGAGGQEYGDPIELIGNTEFRSYDASGLIHVMSTVDSDTSNLIKTYSLTLTNRSAGGADLVAQFDGNIGQTRELNLFKSNTKGDVDVFGDIEAQGVSLRAGDFEVQNVSTTGTQYYFGAGTFAGAITADKLTINSTGDIVNNGAWEVTGLATLSAKNNDIIVTGLGNHFGQLKLNAENVTIEEEGDMVIQYAKVGGTLEVTTSVFGLEEGDLSQGTSRAIINRLEANVAGDLSFTRDDTRIYEIGDITAGGSIEVLIGRARSVLLDGTISGNGDIVLAANANGSGGSFVTGGSSITIDAGVGNRYAVYSYYAADELEGTDLRVDLVGLVDEEPGVPHPVAPTSTDNVLLYIQEER